jgi:hypothetical protein
MSFARHCDHSKRLFLVLALSLLISCSSQHIRGSNNDLLSIPVNGFESIDLDSLNRRLQQITQASGATESLYVVLAKLWSEPYSRNSAITIKMIENVEFEAYTATLIFDNIPDDDSVSGYRYDIKLKKDLHGILHIIEAKKSWRCWQDRGHYDFSVEPCV